jgi:hypothetical protein
MKEKACRQCKECKDVQQKRKRKVKNHNSNDRNNVTKIYSKTKGAECLFRYKQSLSWSRNFPLFREPTVSLLHWTTACH